MANDELSIPSPEKLVLDFGFRIFLDPDRTKTAV
jgi:hypothetical protein